MAKEHGEDLETPRQDRQGWSIASKLEWFSIFRRRL
jgi:hypothetical protein